MTGYARLHDARVVVIGAGVIGAAIAYRLSQAGAVVTLVDRNDPGTGTSGSSFAWLNAFRKPPRAYHRLSAASIRDHRELSDELRGDWLHLDGALVWCSRDDQDLSRQLRDNERTLRTWGYRVEPTTPEVVARELEPDLTIDPATVETVYVLPGEGWIEAQRLAHALVHAAQRRHGLVFERATVCGLSGRERGVDAVRFADGRTYEADVVVNAAGPDAGRIAQLAGVELELDRQPGAFAVTAPTATCLRHVVRSPDAFVRPDGGGRLVIHRDQYDGTIDESTVVSLDHAIAKRATLDASRILPGCANVAIESTRFGIRAMPKDGYPIVGFDENAPGLYHVATHSGVTLSARLALLVTDEISGLEVAELSPYRPGRFVNAARDGAVPMGE